MMIVKYRDFYSNSYIMIVKKYRDLLSLMNRGFLFYNRPVRSITPWHTIETVVDSLGEPRLAW